jgi:hypothetical protein
MSPTLSEEDRVNLLGPVIGFVCDRCKRTFDRKYCMTCDEFFLTCSCEGGAAHLDHRIERQVRR